MIEAVSSGMRTYGGQLERAGARVSNMPEHHDALAVALYESPAYAVSVPPLEVARLSINLSASQVAGALDGARTRSYAARRHTLFLTPAGASAEWRKSSSSRHINIYFHPRAFEHPEDAAWGPLLSDAVPLLNVTLPGAGTLFDMLAAELASGQPFGAEAVDSLARLVLVRLARRHPRSAARANPWTPALQARLTDYIVERLDQRLLVPELASVTGLSPNRFAQAFLAATGLSPHQFVLQLRLERALHMLRHSTLPLADIAAACGFASQQHMTQWMRRRHGTTPARRRADYARDEVLAIAA